MVSYRIGRLSLTTPTAIRNFYLTTLTILSLVLASCAAESNPLRFVIASTKFDGSDFKIILKDSTHNLTHPRVSPNGKLLTLTKYYHKNLDGLCLEESGYFNTEILVANIDGSNLRAVVPHQNGVMAANSSFVDDKHIIYIHFKPPQKTAIRLLDIETGEERELPTPQNLMPSDPHVRGNDFVFGTVDLEKKHPNTIWYSKIDTSLAKQLTHPIFPSYKPESFNLGDYDPRISPDGKKVVFMRYFGKEDWKTFVLDLTKPDAKEVQITNTFAWATPDWTPDGKQLVCFYINRADLKNSGIWLMNPDGSDKKQVNIPRKYIIHNPNTFIDKDLNEPRIIYGAHYNPGIR